MVLSGASLAWQPGHVIVLGSCWHRGIVEYRCDGPASMPDPIGEDVTFHCFILPVVVCLQFKHGRGGYRAVIGLSARGAELEFTITGRVVVGAPDTLSKQLEGSGFQALDETPFVQVFFCSLLDHLAGDIHGLQSL